MLKVLRSPAVEVLLALFNSIIFNFGGEFSPFLSKQLSAFITLELMFPKNILQATLKITSLLGANPLYQLSQDRQSFQASSVTDWLWDFDLIG